MMVLTADSTVRCGSLDLGSSPRDALTVLDPGQQQSVPFGNPRRSRRWDGGLMANVPSYGGKDLSTKAEYEAIP